MATPCHVMAQHHKVAELHALQDRSIARDLAIVPRRRICKVLHRMAECLSSLNTYDGQISSSSCFVVVSATMLM